MKNPAHSGINLDQPSREFNDIMQTHTWYFYSMILIVYWPGILEQDHHFEFKITRTFLFMLKSDIDNMKSSSQSLMQNGSWCFACYYYYSLPTISNQATPIILLLCIIFVILEYF